MDKELLSWIGNAINFLILVYFAVFGIVKNNLDLFQLVIASFGLFISIIIHLYNLVTD